MSPQFYDRFFTEKRYKMSDKTRKEIFTRLYREAIKNHEHLDYLREVRLFLHSQYSETHDQMFLSAAQAVALFILVIHLVDLWDDPAAAGGLN